MYRMQRNQGFQNISFKWPEPQKFPSWLELLGWKAGERNHPKDTSHQFLSMHSHVVYVQVPGAKCTRSEDPLAFFTHHILLHRWCHVYTFQYLSNYASLPLGHGLPKSIMPFHLSRFIG
jgi:hypothetical protein